MLVNVIHPYTYKLDGNTFILGSRKECQYRDENISKFITRALDAGVRTLVHSCNRRNPISDSMQNLL